MAVYIMNTAAGVACGQISGHAGVKLLTGNGFFQRAINRDIIIRFIEGLLHAKQETSLLPYAISLNFHNTRVILS